MAQPSFPQRNADDLLENVCHSRGIVCGYHVASSIHPEHAEPVHCFTVPLVEPVYDKSLSLGRQVCIPAGPTQLVHPVHCSRGGHDKVLLPCDHHDVQAGLVEQALHCN